MTLPSYQREKVVPESLDRLGAIVPALSLLAGAAVAATGIKMQAWQLVAVAVLLLVNALVFWTGRSLARRAGERVGGSLMVVATWVAFVGAATLVSGLHAALGTVALIAAILLTALVIVPGGRVWFWVGGVLVSTAIWLSNKLILPWARFDVNRSPVTWLGAWLVLGSVCVILVLQTIRAYRRASSIPTRLTALVVGLALVTAGAMHGISSLMRAIDERQQVYAHLRDDVALKRVAVESWVKRLSAVLETQAAVDDTMSQLYGAISAGSPEQPDPRAIEVVRDGFDRVVERTQVFREIALVDAEGRVIASTSKPREGSGVAAIAGWMHREQPDESIAAITIDDARAGERVVLVAKPLVRADESMGLLVGWADLRPLAQIVNAGADDWPKVTYVVGSDGVLLADLAGSPVHSDAIDAALAGETPGQLAYTNHEGVAVLGAYEWVPELKIAIVSEVPRTAVGTVAGPSGVRTATIVSAVTALLAALFGGALAYAAAQDVAQPMAALSDATLAIADGDLDQVVDVSSDDEVGALAESLNLMSAQLHDTMRAAERSLHVRTQALKAVAEVSEATASATEPHDLLGKVADVIRQHFALDYVGLYLLDEEHRYAVLRAGTGEVGATMLASGWRLLAGGDSMIGQCVASGELIVMQRATDQVVRLENPLLPNIESEAAVPIRYGTGILGAITAQSRARDAFGEVRMVALRAVADLVAVALRASTPRDRDGLPRPESDDRAAGVLREQRSGDITGYDSRAGAVEPLGASLLPEVAACIDIDGPVVSEDTLRIPLVQADGTVGLLGVVRPDGWHPNEVTLVVALAEELQRLATLHLLRGVPAEPSMANSSES